MKVDVKKLQRGEVELTIELSAEEYEPFLHRAAKIISEKTSIPGFRPGKANLDTIRQRVGDGALWEEALEPAVQGTFGKAITEQNIVTVGSPHVDVVTLAPNNPVIYKAVVAVLPEITVGDFATKKVKHQKVTVDEEKVSKALRDLRESRAAEVIVDRASKESDRVVIDSEGFLDSIPFDGGSQKNFPLVIGEKTFIPGFEDNLIGLKKDDTKEFKLTFPKNYHQKNLAGKEVEFKITMHDVYERTLPELTDDFAKSLGQYKSLAELKEKIYHSFEHEAEDQERARLEELMIDGVLAVSKFGDIPDVLATSETKKMLSELEEQLSRQGVVLADYLMHLKKTHDELMLDFTPQALKRLKTALALRAIRDSEKIEVSSQEIDEEIKSMLAQYGGNPDVEQTLNQPEYRDYLSNVLTSRKVIEHLKSKMVE